MLAHPMTRVRLLMRALKSMRWLSQLVEWNESAAEWGWRRSGRRPDGRRIGEGSGERGAARLAGEQSASGERGEQAQAESDGDAVATRRSLKAASRARSRGPLAAAAQRSSHMGTVAAHNQTDAITANLDSVEVIILIESTWQGSRDQRETTEKIAGQFLNGSAQRSRAIREPPIAASQARSEARNRARLRRDGKIGRWLSKTG